MLNVDYIHRFKGSRVSICVWKLRIGLFQAWLVLLFCCTTYTLFAMSRVSYLLVRDSFNLAFLVTFAFYFLVVKVTKSFGIKRNFFYWPYIIVNVPTMYLLRTTNNIPSTYGIQKKKLHLLLYDLKKPRIFQKLLNLPKKVV